MPAWVARTRRRRSPAGPVFDTRRRHITGETWTSATAPANGDNLQVCSVTHRNVELVTIRLGLQIPDFSYGQASPSSIPLSSPR